MSAQGNQKVFSEAEIGEYNGQGGRPTYIAYRGKVYDVSDSFMWIDGMHMAEHQAGKDLTEELASAPHEEEVFERYPQVGILKGRTEE